MQAWSGHCISLFLQSVGQKESDKTSVIIDSIELFMPF